MPGDGSVLGTVRRPPGGRRWTPETEEGRVRNRAPWKPWWGQGRTLALALLLGTGAPAFSPPGAGAQTVEEQLRALAVENAELYVLPLTEGVGYALSGGLFDRPRSKPPFHFDVAVRVAGAITPLDVRRFDAVLPDSAVVPHPVLGVASVYRDPYRPKGGDPSTPSAAGSGPGVSLEPAGEFRSDLILAGEDPEDYTIQFPEGLRLTVVPYAVAHLAVGVGVGSEIMVRFLPSFELGGELGKARTIGWGVKHTLNHWGELPVDVAVQLGRVEVELGDFAEGSAHELSVLAGRTFGPLTLYGNAGARRSTLEIRYRVENPEGSPVLPQDGTLIAFRSGMDSAFSMGAGFRLQLLLLNLSGQYVVGDYDAFSVKVGLGLP
jgi:hypothetical protein